VLTTNEIVASIRRQIGDFQPPPARADVGAVRHVGDGIAYANGLSGAMAGEIVQFRDGTQGMILNLEQEEVGIIILGDCSRIEEGDAVRGTGRVIDVPVGEGLLGRVVNALGQPIDGKGPVRSEVRYPVERTAPGGCCAPTWTLRFRRD
jgi:F-type H+-transporting ATPase subunit alpha